MAAKAGRSHSVSAVKLANTVRVEKMRKMEKEAKDATIGKLMRRRKADEVV